MLRTNYIQTPETPAITGFPETHMVLTVEEQADIRQTVQEKRPEDFGIPGSLWTLGRTRAYIQKKFRKTINERTLGDYMKRWGMS